MNIGKRLKELRKENGKTQSDIANLLEVSRVAYGFYENDRREIGVQCLIILANYYGVTVDYLVGRTDEFGNKI